jgi:hypothetical protein
MPTQGTFTTRIEMAYRTPHEALALNEDIMRLEQCRKALWDIDPLSVAPTKDEAFKLIKELTGQIRLAESYARRRMLREYLEPAVMRKIERKRKR